MSSAENKPSSFAGKEGTVLGCTELGRGPGPGCFQLSFSHAVIFLLENMVLQRLSFWLFQSSRAAVTNALTGVQTLDIHSFPTGLEAKVQDQMSTQLASVEGLSVLQLAPSYYIFTRWKGQPALWSLVRTLIPSYHPPPSLYPNLNSTLSPTF